MEIPNEALYVFFSAVCLVLEGQLVTLGARLGISHSLLALLSGFLAGYFHTRLGVFGDAVKSASDIDPSYILALFLPMLVFKASLEMNWFVFRRQIMQAVVLSYPGVFLGSVILAIFLKLAMSDFIVLTWTEAIMVGIILSCTDTASLLDTLRRLGAPIKLSSLVEGESLLNDGSCVILFTLLMATLREGHSLFFITRLVINTIGGAVFGLAAGWLTAWWAHSNHRDHVQMMNTIFLGFILLWILCDEHLWESYHHPSRIVGVTVYGLMMAYEKERMPKASLQAVRIFWKYAEFTSETFVYWMTGIIVSMHMKHPQLVWHVSIYMNILLLYVAVMFCRGASLACLFPWVKRMGYGLDRQEALVLSFGGQRGPICLTLALILTREKKAEGSILIFCATGVMLLSVLINGNLTRMLIKRSRIIRASRMRIRMLLALLGRVIGLTQSAFRENKQLELLIDLTELREMQKQAKERLSQAIATDRQFRQMGNIELNDVLALVLRRQGHQDLTESLMEQDHVYMEEEMYEVRVKLLQGFKSILYEYKNENKCSLGSWMILSEAVNLDIHQPDDTISSFEWIEEQFSPFYIRAFLYLSELPFVGYSAQLVVLRTLCLEYEIVSNYIEMVHSLEQRYPSFGLPEVEAEALMAEFLEQKKNAIEYLETLKSNFPVISREMQTKMAAKLIIQRVDSYVEGFALNGQFTEKEYSELKSILEKAAEGLEVYNPSHEKINPENWLSSIPPFDDLSRDLIRALSSEIQLKAFTANEVVFKEGKKAKYLYLIMRGTAELRVNVSEGNLVMDKRAEECAGIESLLGMHYTSQLIAREAFFSLRISANSLLKIFQVYSDVERRFWLNNMHDLLNLHEIILEDDTRNALSSAELRHFKPGESTDQTILLVRGRMLIEHASHVIGYFGPGEKKVVVASTAFVLPHPEPSHE